MLKNVQWFRDSAVLCVIVIAGILPFSSRAAFMDEHIYLRIAENVQNNLFFPQDAPSVFFGLPTRNDVAITHPPVGQYYLALGYFLLGRFSEVPFRLMFSVFSVTAVLAFYFIARRFTEQPLLVSALFALTPAFFVMSSTLMMDMPMIAFLLTGLALYLVHLDGRRYALVVASVCWILSLGTGYTALVPLGCLFLQMLISKRSMKELCAVAAPVVAVAMWQFAMAIHFGSLPFARTAGFFFGRGQMVHNAAATLSFLGAVTLFPWSVLGVSRRPEVLTVILAVAVAAGFAVSETSSVGAGTWYVVLAVSGLLVLIAYARSAAQMIKMRENGPPLYMVLWVPATVLFFIIVADMINARYILLMVPPLYLVLFRNTTARRLTFVLIPTAVLSVVLAYSDFVFVNSYRDWVHKTVPPLQAQGFRLWGGAESGLRFYLEKLSIPSLSFVDLRPVGADLVVRHDLFRYGLAEDVEVMLIVLKRFPLSSDFPIQTFSRSSGAGFHDSRIGITPFSVSQTPLDHVEIAQVSPFVTDLPQKGVPAEDIAAWSPDGVILKQSVERRDFDVKIPAQSELQYEVEGQGKAVMRGQTITLKRTGSGTIVWKNLRIMPLQFVSDVH